MAQNHGDTMFQWFGKKAVFDLLLHRIGRFLLLLLRNFDIEENENAAFVYMTNAAFSMFLVLMV